MPPTPIYTVTYDGEQLPGYVQTEDRPVVMRSIDDTVIGREGLISSSIGASGRAIALTFLVKSSLGSGNSDLLHLEDCKSQWRQAIKILTRNPGMKQLMIQDSDRYYLAKADKISMPLSAGQSRSIIYTVDFTAQPWAIATTPATDSFSGNGLISLAIGDSRKTYPIFAIPDTVTAFTAYDGSGKQLEFVRGSYGAVHVTVDTGRLLAYRTFNGVSAAITMNNLNFGLNYSGDDGIYDINIIDYAGSGTVDVEMYARYEL